MPRKKKQKYPSINIHRASKVHLTTGFGYLGFYLDNIYEPTVQIFSHIYKELSKKTLNFFEHNKTGAFIQSMLGELDGKEETTN